MSGVSDEFDYTADDLFAGAGGWDLAAREHSIHARGVEIMPEARATRDAAGLTTIHDDVWTFEPDGQASGLIASPPCQSFSMAGKGVGRKALDDVLAAIWSGAYTDRQALRDVGEKVGDDRTALVLTPLHFAMSGGYRWLAWEQVPAVLPVWEACAEVLDGAGWSTWTGFLHAEQYGVPQTRKRAFLIASLDGPVSPPVPTHSLYYSTDPGRLDMGVDPWVSMAEGIGWGMTARPAPCLTNSTGRGLAGGSNSRKTLHRERAEGRWRDFAYGLLDRPSPTVTGGGTDTGGAEPIAKLARYVGQPGWVGRADPGGSVRVTVQEAGILQSFPAAYPWQGKQGKRYLQVGNAVPPVLAAQALGSAVTDRKAAVA